VGCTPPKQTADPGTPSHAAAPSQSFTPSLQLLSPSLSSPLAPTPQQHTGGAASVSLQEMDQLAAFFEKQQRRDDLIISELKAEVQALRATAQAAAACHPLSGVLSQVRPILWFPSLPVPSDWCWCEGDLQWVCRREPGTAGGAAGSTAEIARDAALGRCYIHLPWLTPRITYE
jgi:hypothetical protein